MDNTNSNQNTTPIAPNAPQPTEGTTPPPAPIEAPAPTPQSVPTPVQQPTQDMPPVTTPPNNTPIKSSNSGGNKVIMAIGVILIIAVVTGAGAYLFKSYNSQPAPVVPAQVNYTPTTVPSPTLASPSSELENLDIGNPEADLNNINQDINQL